MGGNKEHKGIVNGTLNIKRHGSSSVVKGLILVCNCLLDTALAKLGD